MTNEKKHYELAFIIAGSLAEDQHPAIISQVKATLESQEAEITHSGDLGRKKLAYAIDKLKHGFYYFFEFNVQPIKIKEIEKILKLQSGLLRFLITKKKQRTVEEIAKQEEIQAKREKPEEKTEEKRQEKVQEKQPEKPKISLEDLDKKLDEILEEEII